MIHIILRCAILHLVLGCYAEELIDTGLTGIPCPQVRCPIYCPYGSELSDKGCPTCNCIDHCKIHCNTDDVCEVEELQCSNQPCGIKIKCPCPRLSCFMYMKCTYGFQVDCNNCSICACNNPCGGVICPIYHYCEVQRTSDFVPFPVCKGYCPHGTLLIDDNNTPATCTTDLKTKPCPTPSTCYAVPALNRAFCCT